MYVLFSVMWFVIGVIFMIAGKDFIEVCACFLLFGLFAGVEELYLFRKQLDIEKIIVSSIKKGDSEDDLSL